MQILSQQTLLQDQYLALFVLCLVIIDLIILGMYTVIESIRGNLGVKTISNREMPEETIGVCFIFIRVSVDCM